MNEKKTNCWVRIEQVGRTLSGGLRVRGTIGSRIVHGVQAGGRIWEATANSIRVEGKRVANQFESMMIVETMVVEEVRRPLRKRIGN